MNRDQMATLKGDMEREGAVIGAVITLEEPTRPTREEAAAAGFYIPELYPDRKCPRIQVLTIEELLSGKELQYPRVAPPATFKPGGLSATSVRYIHAIAHGALEPAFKEGLIACNPAKTVRLPQKAKKEMKTLDSDGVGAFLSEARRSRLYAAFLLELATGLRRGELLGLRWQDLDLEAETVRVEQQLVLTRDGPKFQVPKTHLSRRTVSVPTGVVKELRAHRVRQAEERLLLGEAYQDNGLVFATEDGRPLDPRAFTRLFERILNRAGLPRMAFHDLRHTFATLSLQEGVSVRAIQETLGHHTAAFTMTTYAHVTDSMRREATDKVGGLLEACIRE